jgi:16S rRNA (guanine966-N2)-methyltransferase
VRAGAGSLMTRIVSGAWGGRRLTLPKDPRVRPTAERVREAWLSILGPDIMDANVLDLCAGSGALGLEALSRGARHATFVDLSAPSLDAIRRNIDTLGAGTRATVRRADAVRFVTGLDAATFDVALADPPFSTDLAARIAERFRAVPFASVLAVEHAPTTAIAGGETRRWGDIAVTFFRAP